MKNALTYHFGKFCIPTLAGVEVTDVFSDFDYWARYFRLPSRKEAVALQSSIEYSEIDYDYQGLRIIDARGKTAEGKLWRSLGLWVKLPPKPNPST